MSILRLPSVARALQAFGVLAAAAILVMAMAAVVSADSRPSPSRHIIGQASWYGGSFAWRPTASGQLFDPEKLTGAHRTLPFGTKVVVTNLHNGRSVLVTITDRGPFWPRRDIDLSYGAARVLGMVHRGVARVRIEPLEL